MDDDLSHLYEVLDDNEKKSLKDFIAEFSSQVETSAHSWIVALASDELSERTYSRLRRLAWFIFVERSFYGRKGRPRRFKLTKSLKEFQELIYKLYVFRIIKVPFSRWRHLLEEACKLFIDSGGQLLDKKKKNEFLKKLDALEGKIGNSPEYIQIYCDYLNGAL